MMNAVAAQDDSSRDVDEIAGRHEIADHIEKLGHGFARKDVAGEKYAGKNCEKSQLHGLGLGVGFAGDQDTQRERDEDVGEGEEGKQKNAAVNRHVEREAHEGEDEEKFEKADNEVRKQLAEKQAHG